MLDLNNHFLVAMPSMEDDDFEKAVVFVFSHGSHGAAGLVINRPSALTIQRMLVRMGLTLQRSDLQTTPVFNGGPVLPDRGFILHEAQQAYVYGEEGAALAPSSLWASSITVSGGLEITTSRDVLEAMAAGSGPQKMLVALGYAAWQPGQLEREIASNDWLVVPASHCLLFDTPSEQRYPSALALLGLDEVMLTPRVGAMQ